MRIVAAAPLVLLVGCSSPVAVDEPQESPGIEFESQESPGVVPEPHESPGFVLESHEGDEGGEGFAAPRAVYMGSGLAARSEPGVDEFDVQLPEGEPLRVRREMAAGQYTAAADLNFDGDFGDEEAISFPAAGAAYHVVRPEGATAVRLNLMAGGSVEYRLEPVYTATVASGEESLDIVVALLPPESALMFGDPQRDGSYPMYISPETAIGLGGRVFTASVTYGPPRVVLTESDQPTTQPGDPVPSLEGTALAEVMDEAGEDSEAVLIFAHPRCPGCMSASPLADLARAASDPDQQWVWLVGEEAHVELIRESMGEGQAVLADAGAWGTFGASATPTLLRLSAVDESGTRTILGRVSSAESDRLREALGWDRADEDLTVPSAAAVLRARSPPLFSHDRRTPSATRTTVQERRSATVCERHGPEREPSPCMLQSAFESTRRGCDDDRAAVFQTANKRNRESCESP